MGGLSPSAMWRISGLNAEELGKIEALEIISAHWKIRVGEWSAYDFLIWMRCEFRRSPHLRFGCKWLVQNTSHFGKV